MLQWNNLVYTKVNLALSCRILLQCAAVLALTECELRFMHIDVLSCSASCSYVGVTSPVCDVNVTPTATIGGSDSHSSIKVATVRVATNPQTQSRDSFVAVLYVEVEHWSHFSGLLGSWSTWPSRTSRRVGGRASGIIVYMPICN